MKDKKEISISRILMFIKILILIKMSYRKVLQKKKKKNLLL